MEEELFEGYLSTLGKAISVLESLRESPKTISELASELGIQRAGVYRILRTLETHKMVQREVDGTKFFLGIALWTLGSAALPKVESLARDWVRELATTSGETVHLAIYDSGDAVYVDKADGFHPIRSYTRLGGRAPAYCVATGKALLCYQSPAEIERLVQRGLQSYTTATLDDKEKLLKELTEIRERGFAENRGEWREEVGGFAVPLRDMKGQVVAALGFSGPVMRLRKNRKALVDALMKASEAISKGEYSTSME